MSLRPLEYEAGVLTTRPLCSVLLSRACAERAILTSLPPSPLPLRRQDKCREQYRYINVLALKANVIVHYSQRPI
jgi:hypothetical protein